MSKLLSAKDKDNYFRSPSSCFSFFLSAIFSHTFVSSFHCYLISLSQLIQLHDLGALVVDLLPQPRQIVLQLVVVDVPRIVAELLHKFQVQDPLVLMLQLRVRVLKRLGPLSAALGQLLGDQRCR